MNRFSRTTGLSWTCGLAALCVAACSPATSDSRTTGAAGDGSGMTPSAGSSSSGNIGGDANGGLHITMGGSDDSTTAQGGSPGALGSGGVCVADSHEGQRVPLDMYFLVDSSGSMKDLIAGGGSRWAAVSGALIDFLKQPGNAESALGFGYFPFISTTSTCKMEEPNCVCIMGLCMPYSLDLGSCNADDYAMPTVPLMLPPTAAPLIADLQAHVVVNGGTPTRPALEGAVKYVSSWVAMHPDRKSVIVLATDGEPTGCVPNVVQDVVDVAAAALAGPAAIQTFVIGVGDSLQSMNLIAGAGGTEQAYLVEDANAAIAFGQALEQIRGVAAPCDFVIPTEGAKGKMVDPSRVNVQYTPMGSTMPTLVAQTTDGSATTCGPDGGWHYDNPAAPTAIKLCPTTCTSLGGGSVTVQFGCQTIVQPPR
jgi:hypothetical protein